MNGNCLPVVALTTALALAPTFARCEGHHALAIAGKDQVALHDLSTGAELARFDAGGATSDLAALSNGTMLVNLTGTNQVLLIDAERATEIGRIAASSIGGTRPVHMYMSPALAGSRGCRWQIGEEGEH
jgi:hypothetical protein